MKLLKRLLMLVVIGVVILSSVGPVYAQEGGPAEDDPSEEIIQIVLVLDVSQSMEALVPFGEFPAELKDILDKIDAIENDEELNEIKEQLNAIVEDPEVVNARQVWQDTISALDAWFSENDYGESQAAVMAPIANALRELGCDTSYARWIASALTYTEVNYWIDQACPDVEYTAQDQQDIQNLVLYLGDPGYTTLQETSTAAYEAYFDILEARNYNDLIQQREDILANANYEALLEERDILVAEYDIPTKLDLAKLAAKTLLGLSRLDSVAGRRISLVALVRFSTDYVLLQELTTNDDIVDQKIEVLEPLELTNVYGGLDEALKELERNADPDQSTVIILLSDGHITVGPDSDQVLKDIPPRADDLNATICTVGFGASEAHVDKRLLEGLAEATAGEYLFAESGAELMNFFIACRQGLLGEVKRISGIVQPGDAPTEVDTLKMSDNVCELSLALNYVSGDPALSILSPQDTPVDGDYPGYTSQTGDNLKLYTLMNPAEGNWQVLIHGESDSEEEVVYSIVITVNDCASTPTPSPTPYLTPTPLPEPSLVEQAAPVLPLAGLVLFVLVIFLIFHFRGSKK